MSALNKQVGGKHYASRKVQPIEYIHGNGLGFLEGCIVKRITRWRDKNGLEDLLKARHEIDLLIEMEGLEKEEAGNPSTKLTQEEYNRLWRRIIRHMEPAEPSPAHFWLGDQA